MLLNVIASFYIFSRRGTSSQILRTLTKTFLMLNVVDIVRQFVSSYCRKIKSNNYQIKCLNQNIVTYKTNKHIKQTKKSLRVSRNYESYMKHELINVFKK